MPSDSKNVSSRHCARNAKRNSVSYLSETTPDFKGFQRAHALMVKSKVILLNAARKNARFTSRCASLRADPNPDLTPGWLSPQRKKTTKCSSGQFPLSFRILKFSQTAARHERLYKTNRLRCLLSMSRKATVIAACLIVVAGIVFILGSASGGRSSTPPRSAWNFTFTMPTSNITGASQTNIAPQTK